MTSVKHYFSQSSSSTTDPTHELLDPSKAHEVLHQLYALEFGAVSPEIADTMIVEDDEPEAVNALLPNKVLDRYSRDSLIDTTLLHNPTSKDINIIRDIYHHFTYEVAMTHFVQPQDKEHTPKYSMRKVKPGDENIIYKPCQSSKSPDTSWAAWCSYFIDGTTPVLLVRNSGGKIQGKVDAAKSIEYLNGRIKTFLLTQGMAEQDCSRYLLKCRQSVEDIEFKDDDTMDAQVLIVLFNVTQLRKIAVRVKSRRKWHNCVLLQKRGVNSWKVKVENLFGMSKVFDNINDTNIKRKGLKNKSDLTVGDTGQVKLNSDQCTGSCLLKQLGDRDLLKDEKFRVTFLIDEADLATSRPSRNGTGGERLISSDSFSHLTPAKSPANKSSKQQLAYSSSSSSDSSSDDSDFDDEEKDADDDGDQIKLWAERRGISEHIFNTISITATPMAIMSCSFSSTDGLLCGCCHQEIADDHEKWSCVRVSELSTGCQMSFHKSCFEKLAKNPLSVPGGNFNQAWQCWGANSNYNPHANKSDHCPCCVENEARSSMELMGDTDLDGKIVAVLAAAPKSQLKLMPPGEKHRVIKPNVIVGDVPSNYMCYSEQAEDPERPRPHKIKREVLELRTSMESRKAKEYYFKVLTEDARVNPLLLQRFPNEGDFEAHLHDIEQAAEQGAPLERYFIEGTNSWYMNKHKDGTVRCNPPHSKLQTDHDKVLLAQYR